MLKNKWITVIASSLCCVLASSAQDSRAADVSRAPASANASSDATGTALVARLAALEAESRAVATELVSLRTSISEAVVQRTQLETSIQTLYREIEQHLGNADKAEKRHEKAVKKRKPDAGPPPSADLELAHKEYQAVPGKAKTLERQLAEERALDQKLDSWATQARSLQARANRTANEARTLPARIRALLIALGDRTSNASKEARLVRDQTGFSLTGSFARTSEQTQQAIREAELTLGNIAAGQKRVATLAARAPANVAVAKPSPTHSAVSAGPDIVGLRLGMTLDQVRAVLQAHDATMELVTSNAQDWLDGWSVGDPYLRTLVASTPSRVGFQNETITITFARPPAEPRVIDVFRSHGQDPAQATSHRVFREALVKKYGAPREESVTPLGYSTKLSLNWSYPSKGSYCTTGMAPSARYAPSADATRSWLTSNRIAAEACADVVTVELPSNPVLTAYARLTNVGKLILNAEANLAQVRVIRQRAVEQQQSQATTVPKL